MKLEALHAPMPLDEAISFLSWMVAQFVWRTDSVQPEVLKELLEPKLASGSVSAAGLSEKPVNELLPGGYSSSTCLYEAVVGELPASFISGGEGAESPAATSGSDALQDGLCQGGEVFHGDAVAVKEMADAFQGSHAAEKTMNAGGDAI